MVGGSTAWLPRRASIAMGTSHGDRVFFSFPTNPPFNHEGSRIMFDSQEEKGSKKSSAVRTVTFLQSCRSPSNTCRSPLIRRFRPRHWSLGLGRGAPVPWNKGSRANPPRLLGWAVETTTGGGKAPGPTSRVRGCPSFRAKKRKEG